MQLRSAAQRQTWRGFLCFDSSRTLNAIRLINTTLHFQRQPFHYASIRSDLSKPFINQSESLSSPVRTLIKAPSPSLSLFAASTTTYTRQHGYRTFSHQLLLFLTGNDLGIISMLPL